MTIQLNAQDKIKTLPQLMGYYEICDRAEGKSEKTVN